MVLWCRQDYPVLSWPLVDTLLITVCLCSSSCSLSRMTWTSLAHVPPLNHPGLNNSRGQIPFQITHQLFNAHTHTHALTHTLKCLPLTSEPLVKASKWNMYIQANKSTAEGTQSTRSKAYKHTHTHRMWTHWPEGETEWSSNVEEHWLVIVEQSESKWASALPWECLTSSHVGGHELYCWSSSWCYEAFVCKGYSCQIWGVNKSVTSDYVAHWRQS